MLIATVIRRFGAPILGIALIIIGIVLLVTTQPASFGWTAYAPLAETRYQPMSPETQTITGVCLLLVGVVISAVWGLFLWRRRTAKPGPGSEKPRNPLP